MAGYIGKSQGVTQVDGYNRTEADDRYVNASGDTMTGDLIVDTKVGIGTGTPRNVIHAHNADNGGIRFSNTATGSGASDGFYVGNVFGSTDALLQNYEAGAIRFNTSATERMRIDSAGRVTMPYQPSVKAYTTSNVSLISSSYVVVPFAATDFDIGGNFNTSIYRFTAPVSGKYLITFSLRFQGVTSYAYGYIRNNAVDKFYWHTEQTVGGSERKAWSTILELSVADYVDLTCRANGNVGYIDIAEMTCTLIG